jgi:Na+/proline symporter
MLSFPRLPLLGLLLVHPVLGLLLSLILAAVQTTSMMTLHATISIVSVKENAEKKGNEPRTSCYHQEEAGSTAERWPT